MAEVNRPHDKSENNTTSSQTIQQHESHHSINSKIQLWISVISLILAIIALLVSYFLSSRSNQVASEANQLALEANQISKTAEYIALLQAEPQTKVTFTDTLQGGGEQCILLLQLLNNGGATEQLQRYYAMATVNGHQVQLWSDIGPEVASNRSSFIPEISNVDIMLFVHKEKVFAINTEKEMIPDNWILFPYAIEPHSTLELFALVSMGIDHDALPEFNTDITKDSDLSDISITFDFETVSGNHIYSAPIYCTSINNPDK